MPRMLHVLHTLAGRVVEQVIHWLVYTTGRVVPKGTLLWLEAPIGTSAHIGADFYDALAARENLRLSPAPDAGLMPRFADLASDCFDPDKVHVAIRHFYEHTARYRLTVATKSSLLQRFCIWFLVFFVSRRMDQLNFPLSQDELAKGMTSEILPLCSRATGERVYTGWLRRMVGSGLVVYAGLYQVATPTRYSRPCVKVTFPVPRGCATVFLRPENNSDNDSGDFRLISSGGGWGDPGFYRVIEANPRFYRVRYFRGLREYFDLHVGADGLVRCLHTVSFHHLPMIRLHYTMTKR